MAKQLFGNFSSDIIRAEYRHVQPISKLNLNIPNKKTTFLIDFNDNFTTKSLQFSIKGEYKHSDDNAYYGAKANVKLVDNFVPNLFSYIDVKKHNNKIDEVDYPGMTSTIKQTVGVNSNDKGYLESSGFHSIFSGGGTFSVLGKLSDLGLGFFDDISMPIFKGGFEINFTRNTDDDALFRWKTVKADGTYDDATLPHAGKVVISDFYIRVPIMEYEDSRKILLIKSLEEISSKNEYTFNYKSFQCIQHKNVVGKTLNFDITNVYRNFNDPVCAMVVFQTNKSNDQLKNNSKFDHANVKNIYMEVNGKKYPEELTDLDFNNEDYLIAYDMFVAYGKIMQLNNRAPIPLHDFCNERPIFVIDLSRKPPSITNSKSNIVLHVDFNKNISAPTATTEGTICYVVIVSYKSLNYDIIKNVLNEN